VCTVQKIQAFQGGQRFWKSDAAAKERAVCLMLVEEQSEAMEVQVWGPVDK